MTESLSARLRQDLNRALKAAEAARVATLRMLMSELRNEEIEKGRALTDDEFLALVSAGVKSRQESAEHFRGAGRTELVEREEAEIAVLRGYLPSPLEPAELAALVEQAVAETGASTPREMGKVMGWLMPRVRGRADGADVSRRVKEKLGG